MASSLQRFEPRMRTADAPVFSRPNTENEQMARWEMRIGLSHVIVLWAVLAGMMVMVFLFGFHAGREQGLSRALSLSAEETVRLPVAMPIPAKTEGQLAADATSAAEQPTTSASQGGNAEASKQAQVGESPKVEAEPTFDFSKSGSGGNSKKGTVTTETAKGSAPGFSSKPALGLFAEDAESDKKALAALEEAKAKAPTAPAATQDAKEKQVAAADKPGLRQISPPLKKPTTASKPEAATEGIEPTSGASRIKVQSVTTGLARGWYVQAAATRTKDDSAALVAKFGEKGLAGVVEEAKVRGGTYYRVLIGPFADKETAQNSRAAVKKSGITGGEPFIKHVD